MCTFSASINDDPLPSVENPANDTLNESNINCLKSTEFLVLPGEVDEPTRPETEQATLKESRFVLFTIFFRRAAMVEDDFDPQPHKQGERDCAFDFGLSFDLNFSSTVGKARGIMGLWDGERGGKGRWTLSRRRPEELLGLRTH